MQAAPEGVSNQAGGDIERGMDEHVEQLWQVRVQHITWTCTIRFVSESWGWMVSLERDGSPFGGHRHLMRADALKWADDTRQDIEKGWPTS